MMMVMSNPTMRKNPAIPAHTRNPTMYTAAVAPLVMVVKSLMVLMMGVRLGLG
jgi:hypothetical protein